jgi:hypothetical protein
MRGRIYRHRVAHGKGASFQLFSSGPPYVHRGVKPQGAVEGRSSRSQSQPGLSVHADRMLASDDPHKRRGCVPRRSLPFGQSGRLYAFRADDRASGHEIASWLGDGREESRRAAIDSRCRIRLDAIICVAAHETTAADDDQSSAGARSAPISLPHLCESSSRAAAIAFHASQQRRLARGAAAPPCSLRYDKPSPRCRCPSRDGSRLARARAGSDAGRTVAGSGRSPSRVGRSLASVSLSVATASGFFRRFAAVLGSENARKNRRFRVVAAASRWPDARRQVDVDTGGAGGAEAVDERSLWCYVPGRLQSPRFPGTSEPCSAHSPPQAGARPPDQPPRVSRSACRALQLSGLPRRRLEHARPA